MEGEVKVEQSHVKHVKLVTLGRVEAAKLVT